MLAPQSDVILQFREQGFRLLSLPLCFGDLSQLPRALWARSLGWMIRPRKAALMHCEHGPHFLRVPMYL